MICFIYKSLKKDGLYLYINTKDDFSRIPKPLFDSLGEPQFVMQLELTPTRKLAREDPAKVIKQLESKGFFIQMPATKLPRPEQLQ